MLLSYYCPSYPLRGKKKKTLIIWVIISIIRCVCNQEGPTVGPNFENKKCHPHSELIAVMRNIVTDGIVKEISYSWFTVKVD